MAIKQIVDDAQVEPTGPFLIINVLQYLETVEPGVNNLDCALAICEEMITQLVYVEVPSQACLIKDYKGEIGKVSEIFERIVHKSGDFEKVFVCCLQTLYQLIVKMDTAKPSTAAAIVFNIYDDEVIPKSIHTLLTNTPSNDLDQDVKKVIVTLCNWMRSASGYTYLNKCIIDLLEGLRLIEKFDLLLDIANEVIERLFLSLIIPVIRPIVLPVVIHILTSVQHTPSIFHKLLLRIPNVLNTIETSKSNPINYDTATEENLQKLVDVISALIIHFPVTDTKYKDVEAILEVKYSTSLRFQNELHVSPWHNYIHIPIRDQSIPVGLVNIGNTCYMNSVLQALFMTKQFRSEILQVKNAQPIMRSVQEILALMLYSVRPFITPFGTLQTRPQTFRHGFQQDSFEYLGYLLDQLYEEEKKCILKSENDRKIHLNIDLNDNNGHGENGVTNNVNDTMPSNMNGTFSLNSSNFNVGPSESSEMEVDTPTDDSTNTMDFHKDDIVSGIEDVPLESAPPSPPSSPSSTRTLPTAISTPSPPSTTTSTPSLATPLLPAELIKKLPMVTNTLVQRTFTGKVTITNKCLNCSTENNISDTFFDLQLSFPNQDGTDEIEYTTQRLLDGYFETEKLIDDNKYSCEKCKMLCDGERNLKIDDGPSNLILLVKHFKYDRKFHIRRKLMYKVHHNETIGLRIVNEKGETWNLIYHLYAAIIHCGYNMDSGHYYTIAMDSSQNWFKLNDGHVSRSSLNELKNLNKLNTPYILFYELASKQKVDTVMFGINVSATNGLYDTPLSNGMAQHTNGYDKSPDHAKNHSYDNEDFRTSEILSVENLPPHLRHFIHMENQKYRNEMKRANLSRTDWNLTRNNLYNRRSDSDHDPPAGGCGQGSSLISNQYLY